MKTLRITIQAYLFAIIVFGSFDHAFAQADSVIVDTLITRAYIQFLDAAEFDIPDEFDIYIIKTDTAYAMAERVIDSAGAHMLWQFNLMPPRAITDCVYLPHIRGFESELMGSPDIEPEGDDWIARCTFRLNRVWQVEVESDPGGVEVKNLGLNIDRSTDFTTPPIPWDKSLKLELFCVPGRQISYSVNIDAESLFNLPDGLVHNNKFIKNLILEKTDHMNLLTRIKMSKMVKVNKIVFKPKLP